MKFKQDCKMTHKNQECKTKLKLLSKTFHKITIEIMNTPLEILPTYQQQNVLFDDAVILCDGHQRNVSNLCPTAYCEKSSNRRNSLNTPPPVLESSWMQRGTPKKPLKSFYPSISEIPRAPNAILVFSKIPSKAPATKRCYSEPLAKSMPYHRQEVKAIDGSKYEPVMDPSWDQRDEKSNFFHKHEFQRPFVELAPKHWIQLRGSEESLSALRQGFCRSLQCSICSLNFFVIKDAAMAVCPGCRLVIPADDNGMGLGLGMNKDEFDGIHKSDSFGHSTCPPKYQKDEYPLHKHQMRCGKRKILINSNERIGG
jgi:hypothetical protein